LIAKDICVFNHRKKIINKGKYIYGDDLT